jgi:hypothetical protein
MSFDTPVLQDPSTYYDSLNQGLVNVAATNPATVGIVALVGVLAVAAAAYFSSVQPPIGARIPSPGVSLVEAVMWGLLLFLIIVNGLHYLFDVNIAASVSGLFAEVPELDIILNTPSDDDSGLLPPVPEIMRTHQVFHVPGNKYTYDDAQALCKAYGSRLATYDEMDSAQSAGAEWCSYGWSQDQLALFPTQKSTYQTLQQTPGHEHDCGRPGINGGYIANPDVEFGVNCYGHKPVMTPAEQQRMLNQPSHPLTQAQIDIQAQAERYRGELAGIDVAPFSAQRWSEL